MSDRHGKWVPVEPGHVIPAGQPYRVETPHLSQRASEFVDENGPTNVYGGGWFVDLSWPPSPESLEECAWELLRQAVDQFDTKLSIGGIPREALRLRDCVRGLLNLHDGDRIEVAR